jgi:signal transduction histidine kinase
MAALGVHDVALVPMMVGDLFVGALSMLATDADVFDEHAVTMAREIGDHLAIGIRQDELREELQATHRSSRRASRSMQGFAQALREDYGTLLDETGLDYTRRLADAAKHMDTLIQDLLEYSRLSRAELQLCPVSVRVALDLAIQQTAADLGDAVLSVSDGIPWVIAHQRTPVQVFANLIGNAARFGAPGTAPEIRVVATIAGEMVRISVRDNGIGIAPEHQDRIFRVLERLHSQEAYPGTGIGLAIVSKGVRRMGGSVSVESAEGLGSMFCVELPRATGVEPV